MLCKDVEKAIQDNQLDEAVNNHIESCHSCKMYASLHASITLIPSITTVHEEVDEIMRQAARIKKRHDLFSLLGFIALMLTVFSVIITSLEPKMIVFIQGFGTLITPLVLLIIIYLKERKIIHVR